MSIKKSIKPLYFVEFSRIELQLQFRLKLQIIPINNKSFIKRVILLNKDIQTINYQNLRILKIKF